uniref:F-box domain-containing protein n=2 Tax=Chenopodium quinoa TaxID=63459 RepID=A0A803LRF8_CHEQI
MLWLSSFSSSSNSLVVEASDIPCILLIDILARIPLETLFDCRYVCKSWRSVLTEPYFYRLYSHHMPTALILQIKGTLFTTLKEISLIEQKTCGDVAIDNGGFLIRKMRLTLNPHKPAIDLCNLGLIPPNFQFQLGNGCNGLICLREIQTQEPSLVWNPIMGQFVILPKPATTADDKVVAGFGFCGHTNRYKVLRIFHKEGDPSLKRRVEIYDLGVGQEWREIGDAPCLILPRSPCFFTNNSLHWILDYYHCKKNHQNNNDNALNNINEDQDNISLNFELICGFDFVEEKFKSITAPPIYSSNHKYKYHWSNLGIIGNCLSISAVDAKIFRPDLQIWVMEEYGMPEAWALRFSILDPIIEWWDPYKWVQVTNFHRNGEILMLFAHYYVFSYNVRERQYRKVGALDFPVIAHVPSFTSLEDVLSKKHGTGSLNVRYL